MKMQLLVISLITVLFINFNFVSSVSAEDEVPKPAIAPKDISVYVQTESFCELNIWISN